MTILYKPVLIESVAQADALPTGTVVINSSGDRYNLTAAGMWHSVADDRDLTEDIDSSAFPVTITALVPIEAEEEWAITLSDDPPAWSTATREEAQEAKEHTEPVSVRYRTRWENA